MHKNGALQPAFTPRIIIVPVGLKYRPGQIDSPRERGQLRKEEKLLSMRAAMPVNCLRDKNYTTTTSMPDISDERVTARRIDILHEQAATALTTAIIVAAILSLLFWENIRSPTLFLWQGAYTVITLAGFFEAHLYRQRKNNQTHTAYWYFTFNTGVFLTGALWGYFCVFLAQHVDPVYTGVIAFAVGGLAAGALTVYSVSMMSFLLFSTPSILTLAIYLIFRDADAYSDIGYLLIVFYVFLAVAALRFSHVVEKTLRHQLNNQGLIDSLEHEKRALAEQKTSAEALAEKMLALSIKDGLTEIYNRRHFDESLINEWFRSLRSETSLSLILCDIDYFKQYNDNYGHQAGDECLKIIARLVEDYARRAGDVAARYGGEEFALILPDTNSETAGHIAEQIRTAIESQRIPHKTVRGGVVTISLGAASIVPSRVNQPAELVKMADEALYEAKNTGRNRVVIADQTI